MLFWIFPNQRKVPADGFWKFPALHVIGGKPLAKMTHLLQKYAKYISVYWLKTVFPTLCKHPLISYFVPMVAETFLSLTEQLFIHSRAAGGNYFDIAKQQAYSFLFAPFKPSHCFDASQSRETVRWRQMICIKSHVWTNVAVINLRQHRIFFSSFAPPFSDRQHTCTADYCLYLLDKYVYP